MSRKSLLPFFIYAIGELPLQPSVSLNDHEQKLFFAHRFRCTVISLFLRWIRLGEPQSEVLLLPEAQGYEPLARFCDSLLTLAIQVYPRTDDGFIRAFDSPAFLWASCLNALCRDGLAQALTDYPPLKPKKEVIKNTRSSLKSFNDLRLLDESKLFSQKAASKQQSISAAKHPGGTLLAWVLYQAGKIAVADPDFDRDYYRPCLRQLKRVVSSANESKDFQVTWINSKRQLSSTKQFKKRKSSKKY